MNINKLAKETQDILREGVLNIFIYKKSRSWDWFIVEDEDNCENYFKSTDEEKISIENKLQKQYDQNGFVLNGYESIANYSLKAIKEKIKYFYYEVPILNKPQKKIEVVVMEEYDLSKLVKINIDGFESSKEIGLSKEIRLDLFRTLRNLKIFFTIKDNNCIEISKTDEAKFNLAVLNFREYWTNEKGSYDFINQYENKEDNLYEKLIFINNNRNIISYGERFKESINYIDDNLDCYWDLSISTFKELKESINYVYEYYRKILLNK